MNYNEMSDFEINCEVAKIYLQCDYYLNVNQQTVDLISTQTYLGPHGMPDEREVKYAEFDPCGYWSNAGPIIELLFNQGITLIMNDTGVMTNNAGVEFNGKSFDVEGSPLRAAMIVFLMMQEQSDEN